MQLYRQRFDLYNSRPRESAVPAAGFGAARGDHLRPAGNTTTKEFSTWDNSPERRALSLTVAVQCFPGVACVYLGRFDPDVFIEFRMGKRKFHCLLNLLYLLLQSAHIGIALCWCFLHL